MSFLSLIVLQAGQTIQIPAGVQVQGIVTDPFTWLWLTLWSLAGPISAFLFAGLLIWYLYDTGYRTPLESKRIKECSLKKKPLQILEYDAGYLEFKVGSKMGPEGSVHTKNEGRSKRHWTGFFARPSQQRRSMPIYTDSKDEEIKEAVTTNTLAKELGDSSVERRYLKGAKIPVSVGYAGKGILTSIKSIAFLKTCEVLHKIDSTAATYINMGALKTLFGENWNESQIEANETDAGLEGELRAKKMGTHGDLIMMLIAGGIFFGGVAAVIAVISIFFG